MEKIKYYIFNPGGNKTALVIGNHYSVEDRKFINNMILHKHNDVEQVGFLSEDEYRLTMSGGEFCGNATRCAIKYYLGESRNKEILIKVSGTDRLLRGGIDFNGDVWVDVPVNFAKEVNNSIKIVSLDGISHIVIDENLSRKYLKDKANIKANAKKIIDRFNLDSLAVGVMFTEIINNGNIRLYPHCICQEYRYSFF